LEDRDNAGRLSAKHFHGVAVDEVLATVTPAGARYLHQDGLGNVVALTDETGSVLERVRYDAYGQPEHLTAAGAVSGVSPTGNRFLFTGREWFPELGLQDNRHRYYHPGVGRWLSRDPIGELGGLNLYGYVGNRPMSSVDPMGLSACSDFANGAVNAVRDFGALAFAGTSLVVIGPLNYFSHNKNAPHVGFKDELVSGGQGGEVFAHLYGHIGAILGGATVREEEEYQKDLRELAAQEKKRNNGQKNNYCEKAAEVAANKAARQAASILKDFLAGKISEAAAKRLMNETLCK
jgi:RHS repeat-associated protein